MRLLSASAVIAVLVPAFLVIARAQDDNRGPPENRTFMEAKIDEKGSVTEIRCKETTYYVSLDPVIRKRVSDRAVTILDPNTPVTVYCDRKTGLVVELVKGHFKGEIPQPVAAGGVAAEFARCVVDDEVCLELKNKRTTVGRIQTKLKASLKVQYAKQP